MGRANGLAILAAATRVGNPQTYENSVGALWNCGLDLNNVEAMAASAVPEYLAVPVPQGWLMVRGGRGEGGGGKGWHVVGCGLVVLWPHQWCSAHA